MKYSIYRVLVLILFSLLMGGCAVQRAALWGWIAEEAKTPDHELPQFDENWNEVKPESE